MDEKQMKQRARRRRRLMIVVGLAAGVLVYLLLGHQTVRTPIRQVVTMLPEDLREQGLALLGERRSEDENQLVASGVIQADEVLIASELGGRIASLPWSEGDSVQSGELLVQLDTTDLDARIAAAEALAAVAEAGLAQAEAGARPGQIAMAEAQVEQAQAARAAAQQAISDTLVLVENPQNIQLQIAVTLAQIDSAEHQVAQATALKDAIELVKDKYDGLSSSFGADDQKNFEIANGSLDDLPVDIPDAMKDEIADLADGEYSYKDYDLVVENGNYRLSKTANLPLSMQLTPNQWWQAWVGVNAAQAQQQGLQRNLYQLVEQRDNPQALQAQLDQAIYTLAQADAQVAAAQAQLEGYQAGATDEQLAVLEAQVNQARTAVEALQRQRDMLLLSAPLDASVVSLSAQEGEIAAAGATLLALADLSDLSLTIYVPENQIGWVQIDQVLPVSVDSFPGRVFEGTVRHIADSAEFTPRHVATQEERVNLVFAVEIQLDNADGLIKPGMPAEAVIDRGSE